MIGKHTGDLYREDFPSLYLPANEPWYRPRHRAEPVTTVSRNG